MGLVSAHVRIEDSLGFSAKAYYYEENTLFKTSDMYDQLRYFLLPMFFLFCF